MKFRFSMPDGLRPFYRQELSAYRKAMQQGDFPLAWAHLERAHIIGQAYPWEHSYAHWLMLSFGIKIKSLKEVLGQIPRLLVGGVKSFVGKIPKNSNYRNFSHHKNNKERLFCRSFFSFLSFYYF